MQGYSKIKGNSSFIQRSKSNKEFLFIDRDFDLLSTKHTQKKSHFQEQEPSIHGAKNNRKVEFFFEKSDKVASFEQESEDFDGVNEKYSSKDCSYQKNNKWVMNNNHENGSLQRQSSTKAIQEAVKKAFSIKRSVSVNSDRYRRIHDQPNTYIDDCDNYANSYDYDDVNGNYDHHDDDFERNGSFKTNYVCMMKKNSDHNHGRKFVGSKVVKACKRLFSR